MSRDLQVIGDLIYSNEQQFNNVSVFGCDDKNAFQREAAFALQLLSDNKYLAGIALKNQQSLVNAVMNIAAIGISLNPAEKEAYLVPRDGKVCLDISYMGLINLATSNGAVEWVQAAVVHATDQFTINGLDKQPTHSYNAFDPNRGDPVGVFVTAKLANGDYLTGTMNVAEINAIRDKSQGYIAFINGKARSSIWNDYWGEMAKKTIVKRESKMWPKSSRLSKAIHVLNTDSGEGFEKEVVSGEVSHNDMIEQWLNYLLTINSVDTLRLECKRAPREIFAKIKDRVVAHAETLKANDIAGEVVSAASEVVDA